MLAREVEWSEEKRERGAGRVGVDVGDTGKGREESERVTQEGRRKKEKKIIVWAHRLVVGINDKI